MNMPNDLPTVGLSTRYTGAAAYPAGSSGQLSNWLLNARPDFWLGAPSAFGLALPAANATPSTLYAPRGVWLDPQRLIVCDSGNHRVMIWNELPDRDAQPADVVLGQADFFREGPAGGCGDVVAGLHLPTAAIVVEDRLLVADAWHHRILVWNQIPRRSHTRPDYAIGQASLEDVLPNRGQSHPDSRGLYWPYGLAYVAGRLYVTDTGNRRVLGWEGIPAADESPRLVLGQTTPCDQAENRGGGPRDDSFRWPHAIAGDEHTLWIADAGNHRVLGWQGHPTCDCPADWLLGQAEMDRAEENPYRRQGPCSLRFPYALALAHGSNALLVADTANNRVLAWRLPVAKAKFAEADGLIGQLDFDHHGENRWQMVSRDSLCWPYGIAVCGSRLAIADSGNNRVMLWNCRELSIELEYSNG